MIIDECYIPNQKICEITFDMHEHGLIKGIYTDDGELYYLWDVGTDPPFEFEYYHETGDLYYKNIKKDGTMDEAIRICNIKGKDGDIGPGGPAPKIISGFWYVYDDYIKEYVNSGIPLNTAPYIDEDFGHWFIFDFGTLSFQDSGIIGVGHNGSSPRVIDDYWHVYEDETKTFINTNIPLNTAPYLNSETGNWWTFDFNTLSFKDSGVVGRGFSPKIIGGYIYFFDDETQTFVKSDYPLNIAPYIDEENGNWWQFDYDVYSFVDTGVHAKGDKGDRAVIPEMEFEIDENGDLYLLTVSVPVVDFELDQSGNLYAIIGDAYA